MHKKITTKGFSKMNKKKIISIIVSLSMILTNLATAGTVFAEDADVSTAVEVKSVKIVNQDEPETVPYESNDEPTVTTDENGINIVSVKTTGLKKHENAEGNEGYWTGFAVKAPDDAVKVAYKFTTAEEFESASMETLDALEVINENGDNGIAFYTDASDPKTYISVQWLDSEDNGVGTTTDYIMDLTDVTLDWIKTESVSPAIILDGQFTDNSVTATADGDTITVAVTTTDLKKHENAEGNEGYWTGFSVKAPDGATKAKYAFAQTEAELETLIDTALEENINEYGDDGIAFYTNAGAVDAKLYAMLEWWNDDEAICTATKFVIDLSALTLDMPYISRDDVKPAKVVNQNAPGTEPFETYTVTADGTESILVDIDMTELKKHSNGADEKHWTGFAVTAPDDATQFRYAFNSSSENLELGALLPVEPDVFTEEGEAKSGVAFYTDAGSEAPKKYVKLQWFDENGNAISQITHFEMDLTDVTLDWIKTESVSPAIILDGQFTDNSVTATADGDTITVAVTTTDLKKHENAEGNEGYWTGFSVKAPDGATKAKYAFAQTEAELETLIDTALEENINEYGDDGIAFYTNAGAVDAKLYAMLEWWNDDEAICTATKFVIDLSEVTLDMPYISKDTIKAANVTDNANVEVKPYASYTVTATERDNAITASVNATNLKQHENAENEAGYWTGFAAVAPDDATQFKYAFDTTAENLCLGAAIPVETAIFTDEDGNVKDGVAFYTNAGSETPKKYVKLQWFNGTEALTNPTVIEIDLSNVKLYSAPVNKPTGGSSGIKYYVYFDTDGGSTISRAQVSKNGTLKVPSAPTKAGYAFDGWYTDKELTQKYDFASKVTKTFTLYAKWAETEQPFENDWENPFKDIKSTDWFYNSVQYIVDSGLMVGVTDTEFAPNDNLTRAMFVTVIYRLEGEPDVDSASIFTDTEAGSWYEKAVIWAEANDIVEGVSETEFAPHNVMTREQIAAVIYRYAQYKGYVTNTDTNLSSYSDYADISDWAIVALQYAVDCGLISGRTDTTLNPKDTATRAEVATILERFIENKK